jgi:hypothetical protein
LLLPLRLLLLPPDLVAYLPKPKNKTGVNLLDKDATAAPLVSPSQQREMNKQALHVHPSMSTTK